MTDIHDIKPEIEDKSFIIILIFCLTIILLVICYIALRKISKLISKRNKSSKKKEFIDYKRIAIDKLNKMKKTIDHKKLRTDEIKLMVKNISTIIRSFLAGYYATHATAMTKTEVRIEVTEKFEKILARCYLVEFALMDIMPEEVRILILSSLEKIKQCD